MWFLTLLQLQTLSFTSALAFTRCHSNTHPFQHLQPTLYSPLHIAVTLHKTRITWFLLALLAYCSSVCVRICMYIGFCFRWRKVASCDFLISTQLHVKWLMLPPAHVQLTMEPQTLPPDNGCAICKSQGPWPCVRDTVQVGGATCHVTCINFWYTFISE